MNYYFVNDKNIMKVESPIDLGIFTHCVELTTEQVDFYLEHPTASINEIKNMNIVNEPVTIPTFEDTQKNDIQFLSDLSLRISDTIVPNYKVQNAIISLNSINPIYTKQECEDIISEYTRIGTLCRNMFYNYKKQIEECTDENLLHNIVYEAQEEYYKLIN